MGAEGNTGGRSILDEKKKKGSEKMKNVTTNYELEILAGSNSLYSFFFLLPKDLIVSKANERFENDLLLLNFLEMYIVSLKY